MIELIACRVEHQPNIDVLKLVEMRHHEGGRNNQAISSIGSKFSSYYFIE